MSIDHINSNNNTPSPSSTTQDNSNPFDLVTVSFTLQELLKHLQEVMTTQQNGFQTLDTSKSNTTTSTSANTQSSTGMPSKTIGTLTLAQMMADLIMQNSELESYFAEMQQETTTQQTD